MLAQNKQAEVVAKDEKGEDDGHDVPGTGVSSIPAWVRGTIASAISK